MRASTVRFTGKCALSVLMAALLCAPAWADETSEVRTLLQAHKLDEARTKASAFLARQPNDTQMQFLMGLILSEQNKSSEAIAVFTKLAEAHPELPEPHNNLAVLLTAAGQYDKARAALENALRANPNYVIARENLGDVYAKLANQAYGRVLERDPGNANVRLKQSLTDKVIGSTASDNARAAAAALPVPKPRAEPQQAAAVPATGASAPARQGMNGDTVHSELINTVNRWAKAWSARDVDGYLSFYSDDFRPPSGISLARWKEQRRALIAGKGRIEVRVDEPKVEIQGTRATITFRQLYASDRVSDTSRKTLVLARDGSQWKIQEERSK